MSQVKIKHFHLFCGLGGGARGFNRARVQVGQLRGEFDCLGGVDVDASAIADFQRLANAPGTVLDMFDRQQYREFHGCEPPEDWHEATPDDIRRAAQGQRPHIVFLSAPCKGFSGLLSESKSRDSKYRALNHLTLRGIWLTLEAWGDDPPELLIFENVPRIISRGRWLLDQIGELLRSYGYAVAETTHNCGEIGGLAQSRKRFLLVARHREKVPPFLYEPRCRPLRGVGDVLGRFPMPSDPRAGAMHVLPALQWQTWVRLAMVEAGSDWRSLRNLRVADGVLQDFAIVPALEWHAGVLGVCGWEQASCTVTGRAGVTTGQFAVSDPRFSGESEYGQYGVRKWGLPMGAVTAQTAPGGGPNSIADPRLPDSMTRHYNLYRVVPWNHAAQTITGASHVSGGAPGIADPRPPETTFGKYAVVRFDEPAGTVISGSTTGQGAFAVSDPRPGMQREQGDHYLTGGHYGVMRWGQTGYAVSGAACHDNGPWSIADPRVGPYRGEHYGVLCWNRHSRTIVGRANVDKGQWAIADPRIPEARDNLTCMIRSLDGTWHRPFTTLELGALQGLVDPEEHMTLEGGSHSAWRERIGNAVPPPAAQAIAEEMGRTLLLAWSGETFSMGSTPIWVRGVTTALMAARGGGSCD
ncbi:MAG: DNA cytosine methyltransferase [Desulfovibrionaceae bacterium]